jgi:hypothetical protein
VLGGVDRGDRDLGGRDHRVVLCRDRERAGSGPSACAAGAGAADPRRRATAHGPRAEVLLRAHQRPGRKDRSCSAPAGMPLRSRAGSPVEDLGAESPARLLGETARWAAARDPRVDRRRTVDLLPIWISRPEQARQCCRAGASRSSVVVALPGWRPCSRRAPGRGRCRGGSRGAGAPPVSSTIGLTPQNDSSVITTWQASTTWAQAPRTARSTSGRSRSQRWRRGAGVGFERRHGPWWSVALEQVSTSQQAASCGPVEGGCGNSCCLILEPVSYSPSRDSVARRSSSARTGQRRSRRPPPAGWLDELRDVTQPIGERPINVEPSRSGHLSPPPAASPGISYGARPLGPPALGRGGWIWSAARHPRKTAGPL